MGWVKWHCPPDSGFEIRALAVWGRVRYLSVTEAPHNTEFYEWMGKKHFCFFQTAETGKWTPISSVKGSGADHYPRAPAPIIFWSWDRILVQVTIYLRLRIGGDGHRDQSVRENRPWSSNNPQWYIIIFMWATKKKFINLFLFWTQIPVIEAEVNNIVASGRAAYLLAYIFALKYFFPKSIALCVIVGLSIKSLISSVIQSKGDMCLLYKWADTAFWLCRE